jgi:hypothetical protein
MSLEALTFSGVSMEDFGVFKGFSVTSFSFHFGVTMEFSSPIVLYHSPTEVTDAL